MDNSLINEAILSVTATSWRKIALVIGTVQKTLGNNLPPGEAGLELIAKRIEALVHDGRLRAQGDIEKWRHSEIRNPA